MAWRKLLSATAAIAGVLGFAAFTAIAIGVWFAAAELNRRAERAFGEATAALDRVQPMARVIGEAIDAAAAEVKSARPPAEAPSNIPALPKMLIRSALKESPGRVETATRAVDAMSDLLIVVQVALNTVQDAPGVLPVNDGELAAFREKMTATAAALHSADAILRSPGANASEPFAAEEARTIERALAQSRGVVVEVESRLAAIRSQIAAIRSDINARLSIATWAIFALALLGAIGQVALVRWSLC